MKLGKLIKKSLFLKSFNLDKKFLYVLLLDLLFIFLLISLFGLYKFSVKKISTDVGIVSASLQRVNQMLDNDASLSEQLARDVRLAATTLRMFFLKMIALSLVFLSLVAIAGAIIKLKGWSRILKKKFFTLLMGLKLIVITCVWSLIWLVILAITVFGLKFSTNVVNIAVFIEFLICCYFSFILYPVFFRSIDILRSIKETFMLGVSKFYLFVQSFFAIAVVLIVVSAFAGVTDRLLFGVPLLPLIVNALLYTFYLVWVKFYMNSIIEKVY